MCSKEEVQAIIDAHEAKIDKKLEKLEKIYQEKLENSHLAIAKSVSDFGSDLKELRKELRGVLNLYNGASTMKTFFVGVSSVILSISAIGASVIWFVKHFIK